MKTLRGGGNKIMEALTGSKDHQLFGDEHFSDEAPGVRYVLKPIIDITTGEEIEGLFSAWIILNNPKQYNSYTTQMVKGVIAGMHKAGMDHRVVAVVFTAEGNKAFCTGGNTKEYAEHYAYKPQEYAAYMALFNQMVDSILGCRKMVICRVNGMRIAGGQEIGMACDLTVSSDMAIFGQAGPKHGSAPVGGSTDFLSLMLPTTELAMWSCVSCEMWSAYKMKSLGLVIKAVPVLKVEDQWKPNPLVVTGISIVDGQVMSFGDLHTGEKAKKAKAIIKSATIDFTLLDAEVDAILWRLTNLFPGCLQTSIDMVRKQKKASWDASKDGHLQWLAINMMGEAAMGFQAFNNKKKTGGVDTINFLELRRRLAVGLPMDDDMFEAVMPKPVEE